MYPDLSGYGEVPQTADPTATNPMTKFIMPTPAQQAAQQPQQQQLSPETEALLKALRGGGQGSVSGAPAQGGAVQSAGYFGQGMDTTGIGNSIGSLFKPSGYGDTAGALAGVPQF